MVHRRRALDGPLARVLHEQEEDGAAGAGRQLLDASLGQEVTAVILLVLFAV